MTPTVPEKLVPVLDSYKASCGHGDRDGWSTSIKNRLPLGWENLVVTHQKEVMMFIYGKLEEDQPDLVAIKAVASEMFMLTGMVAFISSSTPTMRMVHDFTMAMLWAIDKEMFKHDGAGDFAQDFIAKYFIKYRRC